MDYFKTAQQFRIDNDLSNGFGFIIFDEQEPMCWSYGLKQMGSGFIAVDSAGNHFESLGEQGAEKWHEILEKTEELDMGFKVNLNLEVMLNVSGEKGTVIARSEHLNSNDSYLIQYKNASGCAVEKWWHESDFKVLTTAIGQQ